MPEVSIITPTFNIYSFKKKYLTKNFLPQWRIMSLAKSYFKIKNYTKAQQLCRKINFNNLSYLDKFKIKYPILVSYFLKKIKYYL